MMNSGAPVLILLGITFGCAGFAGQPEYQVKAAYVYNFAKFVEWPASDSLSNVTVCIYGKDPFEGFLDQAVAGKLVHGLPIVVKRLSAVEEIWDQCQVLFLGSMSGARIQSALSRVQGHSVVTIGESDSFAETGGMIGLVVEHGRIQFDINLAQVAAAHLKISSRLVELGSVVSSQGRAKESKK